MKKILWMNYIFAILFITAFIYVAFKRGYVIDPYAVNKGYEFGLLIGKIIPILATILAVIVIKGGASTPRVLALIMNGVVFFTLLISFLSSSVTISAPSIFVVLIGLPFLVNMFALVQLKK